MKNSFCLMELYCSSHIALEWWKLTSFMDEPKNVLIHSWNANWEGWKSNFCSTSIFFQIRPSSCQFRAYDVEHANFFFQNYRIFTHSRQKSSWGKTGVNFINILLGQKLPVDLCWTYWRTMQGIQHRRWVYFLVVCNGEVKLNFVGETE